MTTESMVIRSNGDCTREVYLTEDKDKETNFLSGEGLWFNFRAQTYVVKYMYVHCYSLYSLCYVTYLDLREIHCYPQTANEDASTHFDVHTTKYCSENRNTFL